MKRTGILIFVFAAAFSFAQAPATPVEGSVVSVVLDHVQVQTADGLRVVVLPPGVAVTRVSDVPWTDIKEGEWVGVDSKPGDDGTQESVSINIFSPSIIARARKGQFTMDSGDLMTNAPVEKISGSMTNGSLTLKNDGAMVAIRVSASTPVHRLKDATAADIKASAHIVVRGAPNSDGSFQAAFITLR